MTKRIGFKRGEFIMKLNFQTHSSTCGLKHEAEMRNGLLRHVFHSG